MKPLLKLFNPMVPPPATEYVSVTLATVPPKGAVLGEPSVEIRIGPFRIFLVTVTPEPKWAESISTVAN